MATTTIIPLHTGKGRTVATALGISVNYIENPEKTDGGELITAYQCDPLIADKEFLFSKNQYATITGRDQGKQDVIGYHLRISFKPGETDAETANQIGYDLAMKLTHGNHAFVCCTHVDKAHVHTHVVFNSTSVDCTKKFRNFKGSSFAIRRIADHLCIENGLSIIANPKPSKGTIYAKQKGGERPPTGRDRLRELMDENLIIGNSLEEFLTKLKRAGVEIKYGNQLTFKPPGSKRFFRQDSLGDDYSREAILERLTGKRTVAPPPFVPFKITGQTKFSLLIDIQKKIDEGKGEAYENWARLYNLKQFAKTLIYIQEKGINSYDELAQKSAAASGEFNQKLARIKEIETRLSEITELQKNIGTYRKTKENYQAWIKSGRSNSFYDTFAEDIILHQTAKKYFDSLGLKKFPPMDALKQEYATLAAERKSLYRGYHELKDERTDLLMAKGNVERFLSIGQYAPERVADREQKRHQSHSR